MPVNRRSFLLGLTGAVVTTTLVPFRNSALGSTMTPEERNAILMDKMKGILQSNLEVKKLKVIIPYKDLPNNPGLETEEEYLKNPVYRIPEVSYNKPEFKVYNEKIIEYLKFIDGEYDHTKYNNNEINMIFRQTNLSILDDKELETMTDSGIAISSMRDLLAVNKVYIYRDSNSTLQKEFNKFANKYSRIIIR